MTQGRYTLIDTRFLPEISKTKWQFNREKKKNKTGHIVRCVYNAESYARWVKEKGAKAARCSCCNVTQYLHIELAKLAGWYDPQYVVDHINCCGSDDRDDNLRLATYAENCAHKKPQTNNTLGHAGLDPWCGKLRVRITIYDGIQHGRRRNFRKTLDTFRLNDPMEYNAALAVRINAEIEHYGEYRYNKWNLCPGYLSWCPDCNTRYRNLLGSNPSHERVGYVQAKIAANFDMSIDDEDREWTELWLPKEHRKPLVAVA